MMADIHKRGTELFFYCRVCDDACKGPLQSHIDSPRHQVNNNRAAPQSENAVSTNIIHSRYIHFVAVLTYHRMWENAVLRKMSF